MGVRLTSSRTKLLSFVETSAPPSHSMRLLVSSCHFLWLAAVLLATGQPWSVRASDIKKHTADDASSVDQQDLGEELEATTKTAFSEETMDEISDTATIPQTHHGEKNGSATAPTSSKRMVWGAAVPGVDEAENQNNHYHHSPTPQHFSFSKRTKPEYTPPEGFEISTRVYIDPKDRLAHLDNDPINLPYWDCGVAGSTTSPIPVAAAAFRHSLTSTTPWSGTDGKHPLLAVALSPLVIETNSGESKQVTAGQVILLEDVLVEGHRFLPLPNQELNLLFLTLPQTHYHHGKDRISLRESSKTKHSKHPCPVPSHVQNRHGPLFLSGRSIQRGLWAIMGLTMSTLAAEFVSKTAPLWLAVGVGGTCFVLGGTALAVWAGETLSTQIQVILEQRRLQRHSQNENTAKGTQIPHSGSSTNDEESTIHNRNANETTDQATS